MKLLWASLAVVLFSVMTLFNAPAAYTQGPEQALIAALQSPQGEAWLSSVLFGAPRPQTISGGADGEASTYVAIRLMSATGH